MAREQKLALVQVSSDGQFIPQGPDYNGSMERVLEGGWTIAQIGPISRGGSERQHLVILLLERAEPEEGGAVPLSW